MKGSRWVPQASCNFQEICWRMFVCNIMSQRLNLHSFKIVGMEQCCLLGNFSNFPIQKAHRIKFSAMVYWPLALHPKFTLFAQEKWKIQNFGGKQGVLWEMCKWRILIRKLHLVLCCQALIPGRILMLLERLGQCSVELHYETVLGPRGAIPSGY